MFIHWYGVTCVKIQVGDVHVLINPFHKSVGVSMPRLKVQMVAVSDPKNLNMNNVDGLQGEPFVITSAGEYEKNNVFVYGISHQNQTMFVIEAEGIVLGHLAEITAPLPDSALEYLEGVDVLFLPVSSLNAQSRSTVISQIEPRIIIPTLVKTPKMVLPMESVDAFAKEMGVKSAIREKKLLLKAGKLPTEETQIVLLDPAVSTDS